MTSSTESDVRKALETLVLPEIDQALGACAGVRVDALEGGRFEIAVDLGFPAGRAQDAIEAAIRDAVAATGGEIAGLAVGRSIVAHSVQGNLKPLPSVRNVIAVASGKGGVGKSTVAVNLALALAADGAQVGLLDADIYGPSQPTMVGLAGEKPESLDGKTMNPLRAHGLQVMSIGFLIDPDQPMAWRGPMVTSALNQMLTQTNWDDLDYLIVDMPPGTGDIQLTLSQRIPVAGAVIVTTPQDIALIDARKGLELFRKVSVPVLGIVENMSVHICSQCGHEEPLFGHGGGQALAEAGKVRLLGALPLDIRIREQADSGKPTVAAEPDSPLAASYLAAARRMSATLAAEGRDYASRFPKIVVEDS